MRAIYYDPRAEQAVEADVDSVEGIAQLVRVVAELKTQRGNPTIEIIRAEGATLALSFDGHRAFLVWTDTLGESHHSVGGRYEEHLVFDYFGSWSEAPGEYLVGLDDAIDAVRAFFYSGSPATESVLFSPD
jgi:hypothetical protein